MRLSKCICIKFKQFVGKSFVSVGKEFLKLQICKTRTGKRKTITRTDERGREASIHFRVSKIAAAYVRHPQLNTNRL